MSETRPQPEHSISTTETGSQPEHSTITLSDFWLRFRLFPSQFEEGCFNYWYIVFIIYCLILLILDVVLDIRRGIDLSVVLVHEGEAYKHLLSLTKYDLDNWVLLSEGLALVLVALAFNRWRRGVPLIFQELYERKRIYSVRSDGDLGRDYLRLLEKYQQNLMSGKRYILMSILMLVVLGLILMVVLPRIQSIVSALQYDPLYLSITIIRWPIYLIILAGLVIGYYIAVGGWAMGVTGWYIRKLTSTFDLVIQPSHPDHCGGLKLLGDFCLSMARPILIAAIFLGIYGIGFVLYHKGLSIFAVAADVFLFLFALPLASIAFFFPLWDIHYKMLEKRTAYEDEFSDHILALAKKIQSSLQAGELEKAKIAKEELELIQVLHPDKINYPVWPFDSQILFIFLTSQLVPIISLIVGLNQQGLISQTLKTILSFFFH